MKKNNVSATQLSKLAKCEKMTVLDTYHPKQTFQKGRKALDEGTLAHLHIEKQIRADERCYIASYAYGSDDERTAFLRSWRDEYLLRRQWGKAFVVVYYGCSPLLVRICKKNSRVSRLIQHLLDSILIRLGYELLGESNGWAKGTTSEMEGD